MKDLDLSLDELNETVLAWLKAIDRNPLRDFGESRNERFGKEKSYLSPLPAVPFDYRQQHELTVNRESCLTFQTNRYSVPPVYIGQMLCLKVNPLTDEAELLAEGQTIRNMVLEPVGAKKRRMLPEDEQAISELWMRQFLKRSQNRKTGNVGKYPEVEIRQPGDYDRFFTETTEGMVCTR